MISACRLPAVLLVIMAFGSGSAVQAGEMTEREREFFEQQVRPLLVRHCYECHSAEAETTEGGLSLDSRSGWMTGGDSGSAIEPGNVDGSLLITAVRYDGLEMPPDGKLSAEDIAVLERWVELGAPDPREDVSPVRAPGTIDFDEARDRWAFQRPERSPLPRIERQEWPWNEIDHFLLARMEEAGIVPTHDADRRTWLRRVTFDLTGLPPTPKETSAFLSDDSPQAAARVVDRLLASPAFGEHWGRHWLDVARYADTNGGDFNATYKSAWRYRDYVIDAFNADKPFDQFVREQLAGDLLPFTDRSDRAENLIATGFLMIGCKMLSERDKAKFQMDVVDEQIDTVGRAFLGLTLGCARCHDHKFDPIPTTDYYALAGIFQSTESYRGESQKYVSTWKEVELPVSPELRSRIEAHEAKRARLTESLAALEAREKELSEQLERLVPSPPGVLVDDRQARKQGEWKHSTYSPNFVGEGYVHNEKKELGQKSITYVPDLPSAGRYEVRMSYAGSGGRATNVPVRIVHAEGQEELTVDQTKVAPIDRLWLSLGTFRFEPAAGHSVTIGTAGTDGYVLADAVQFLLRDEAGGEPQPAQASKEVQGLRRELEQTQVSTEQTRKALKDHDAQSPPPIPTCMAVREHQRIGDAAIRIRGEVHREGDIIPRGFLTVLSESARSTLSDTSRSGRLELAQWIASPQNPLTSRVYVNRVWHHLFGRGLVASVDNFGTLGQQPTHPHLLDSLAVEFMDSGWSTKRLIRRIVLSRAYRLATGTPPTAIAGETAEEPNLDPENELFSRARRRRLPAEALRDAILAVSGQLDRNPGGSSVEPLEYLAIATSGKRSADLGVEDNVRRSVYLPMVRNDLPELLALFDVADPELVTGRRSVTNVPAQALYLLNSPFVRRAARKTAERVSAAAADDVGRVDAAYELMLSRTPTPEERERAIAFLRAGNEPAMQEDWTRFLHVLFASTEFRMLD